jgi:hypothetical protein
MQESYRLIGDGKKISKNRPGYGIIKNGRKVFRNHFNVL